MSIETPAETLPEQSVEDAKMRRDEWIAAVEQVISDAEAWATEQHWFVHRGPKTITERPVGSYEVPTLLIQAHAGRFALEPYGCDVIGALGVIDFSVYPSYDSVAIVRTNSGWHIETNPRTISRPWSKQTFLEVASELAKKA